MLQEQVVKGKPWASLSLITPYLKKYAIRLFVGFLALIVVDILQLLIPRVIKWAVDELQNGTATPRGLLIHGGEILLLALVIGLLRFVWRWLLFGFSRLLETHLRDRMFSHILTLDKAFYQRRTIGDIMALATNDLSSIQLATGMGFVAMVDAVVLSLAAIAFMAYIHPTLTLIALAPMPVLAFMARFLSARVHGRFKRVQEQFSKMTEFARSTISSMRLIKAYSQETAQARRFHDLGETYVRDNLRLAVVQGTLFPISTFIGNVSLLLVLFFGGRLTLNGAITAGDFAAFITYLFILTWPMMAMGWVANLFQRGVTSLERIQDLLNERPVVESRLPANEPESKPPHIVHGNIAVRDLTFSYPNQNHPAIRGVSLDIGPGLLGIVGRTGSGKTTLCHLLARLYPVADNTIFFDGRDVNALPVSTVRSAISYVPQDVILFSETIAFNIAMGKPDAAREEIEEVARAAAIHHEIMAMPEGYDTRIGERGIKLSGGQRQRLALARALLPDRPVIVIDDGLSAVDMETEHAIIRSMASYLRNRTCIIVSHRVAPLVEAGRIVVLEDGKVVASGSHERLMTLSPFYAGIYEHQTQNGRGDGEKPGEAV